MERSGHRYPATAESSTADWSPDEHESANAVLARINELLAEGQGLPEAFRQALTDTGSDARIEEIVMQILEENGLAN